MGTACGVWTRVDQVPLVVVPSPSTGGVAGGMVVGSVGGCVIGSVGGGMVGSVGVGDMGSLGGGFIGSVAGSTGGAAVSFIGAGSVGGTSGGGESLLQAVNAKAIAATSGSVMRRIGELLAWVLSRTIGMGA
ncbi:MAG: hypothetical protein ACJ8GV_00780 [Luteimonas sp.]